MADGTENDWPHPWPRITQTIHTVSRDPVTGRLVGKTMPRSPSEPGLGASTKVSTLSCSKTPPDALGVTKHGIWPGIHVTYEDPITGRIRGKRLPKD